MPQTRRPFRLQKRQSRLEFQPLPTSSPDKDGYSNAVQDRLANVRYGGGKKASPIRLTRLSKGRQETNLPTPEPSSQPELNQTSTSSPLSTPPLSPSRVEARELPGNFVVEDEEEEDDLILPSSKRRRIESIKNTGISIDTPTRRSSRRNAELFGSANKSVYNDAEVMRASEAHSTVAQPNEIGSAETSGDEEDVIITKAPQRRGGNRSKQADTFVVNDNSVNFVSSDEEAAPKSPARKRRSAADNFVTEDDEIEYQSSSDDARVQLQRRKRRPSNRASRSKKEQDEIDEDLRDLQDSDQAESSKRKRTRGGPVNTERERTREHFNLLRRRRAGEKVTRLPDSDDEGADEDKQSVDIENIVHESDSYRLMPKYDNEGSSTDSGEEAEQPVEIIDEDDFVVDDADDRPLGRPHPDMPLAFTSYASRKPKELFVHVVEWLVKNKIAPAFSRDDELYRLSLDRVNDQIKAQAGSRLISSAWHSDFKNAILARPSMEVTLVGELDEESFQNCDACNKTNHPARYEFRFSGDAYHQETLEPIDYSDEEADDDDDTASYDQAGHQLPPQSTLFYLGRFCAANAEMGHKLTHWKYHLNESLLTYLEDQGVLSASSILARDKLNKKKREREAESIVDSMEATGEIARLWQELQDDLEDARFGMEGHEARGGRRNAARIGKVRMSKGNGTIEEWSEGGRKRIILQSDSEGE